MKMTNREIRFAQGISQMITRYDQLITAQDTHCPLCEAEWSSATKQVNHSDDCPITKLWQEIAPFIYLPKSKQGDTADYA